MSFSNGSVSSERSEELITYKRRRHSKASSDAQVCANGSVSAAFDLPQITNEPNNIVFTTNWSKGDEHGGLASLVFLSTQEHWKEVLEQMLQSPNISEGGIWHCFKEALVFGNAKFFSRNGTSKNAVQGKETICCHGDGHIENGNHLPREFPKANGSLNAANEYQINTSDLSCMELKDQTVTPVTERCRSVLHDILISENFCLLCSLLCRNFHGIKADGIFDFSLINSRIEKRQYEESSENFDLDIQQVWLKISKIGEQMVHLAKSISNISKTSYHDQVVDHPDGVLRGSKDEEINLGAVEQNDYGVLETKRFHSIAPDQRTMPEQSGGSGLKQMCICKHCGTEADGKRRLVCDGCEAMFHISCIKPTICEIPTNWYCDACRANGKGFPEPDSTHNHEIPHQNCVACERLKDGRTQAWDCENHKQTIMGMYGDTEEVSDSSAEDERSKESRRILSSKLCKLCKTGEEEDKKFMICHHKHCPYKYYHRRCLRHRQIDDYANDGWYCPSCLCRACLINRDDTKIVLCDGCDEAYHIYCMVPPRTTVPRGNWYCIYCMIEIRARRRMKIKCEAFIEKPVKKIARKTNGSAGRSVDMLLSAAEKLNSEDNLATRKKTE